VSASKLAAVPSVRVLLSTSGTAVANGGNLVIPFNVELHDNADMHSDAQPTRLVAPVAGIYGVSATVRWEGDTLGFRTVRILENGVNTAEVAGMVGAPNPEGGFFTAQNITGQVRLDAGEYVTVRADQTGVVGGTDVIGDANPLTYASMTFLSN
jgi:hypothetical protein